MDNNYNHGGDGDGRRSLSFGRREGSNSQGRTISNNNDGRSTGRGIVPRGIVDGTRGGERGIPQDCATSNYSRLIHDQATWKFLQDTYYQTVDNNSNDDEYSRKKRFSKKPSGFTVDVIVKDDGYRGRSVYANQFIQQGTKIWNSIHLVSFQTPKQFKSFLFNLDSTSKSKSNVRGGLNKKNKIDINVHDVQCDILLWSYVEKGEGYVSLALDDGSFVNHGETSDVINLDKDCSAIRDIEIGEELLENYTEFIGFKEIKWFDEIRGNAWKEPSIQKTVAKSTDTYNKFGAPKMNNAFDYNQNQNGGAIIIDYTTSTIDYYTDINVNPKSPKAVMVLFSIIGMIIIFVYYALKKFFPSHFFSKKEKDGI